MDISEDMASSIFMGSDERRKEQSSLKRTKTGLLQCESRYEKYLSIKGKKGLQTARDILDKFWGATERSKKVAIKKEQLQELEWEKKRIQDNFKACGSIPGRSGPEGIAFKV